MSINLSQLPKPEVIEELAFETVLSEMLADFQDRYGAFDAPVESDPAYKLLESAAYRETLLRGRINDAARAVLLAFSQKADLEHLAALQNVERLLLDPGDPLAVPPVAPTFESDERLIERVQLAPEGQSTAGPSGAYEFHGTSASALIADIAVASPSAVSVVVTVLALAGDGTPDQDLLDAVTAALADDRKIRPLTDQVTVQAATIVNYAVEAALDIYKGFDAETVRAAAAAAAAVYATENRKLGRSITDSGLKQALHRPGVHQVDLTSLLPPVIAADEAAYCTGIVVTVGSVVDE
jgi:phage-related baseplate assembly protein